MAEPTALPIETVLPALCEALAGPGLAVLAAPPGAGKTTRVPLALLDAPWRAGRILVLEPRRLAARAAATRMAEMLGEPVGATVGYRIRGENRTGPDTRIEVITEGILTRMLQGDAELPGVSAILFDEIHERSIHSDFGMALALEVRAALRPDLRLLAMSATLDTAAWAALLGGCPAIASEGRMFPVETRHLERPWRRPSGPPRRLEAAVAELAAQAVAEEAGDLLVFLPGQGEIRRCGERLSALCPGLDVVPLYGALPFASQQKALRAGPRRRAVLATALAETSLTVEGVRIVVDGGLSRRARVNPATGMSALVTEPVSRAEADQRCGRAGRVAPGVCYRLWTKGEEGALPAFAPPEILTADLTPLALELAQWGVDDPGGLAFLDPPPAGALTEARALLRALGGLQTGADGVDRITAHGREMAGHPLHPRLAHMLIRAMAAGEGATAALVAALLSEGDPMRGAPGAGADLTARLLALTAGRGAGAAALDAGKADRIRREAKRLAGKGGAADPSAAGRVLALAYPDRVGLRRPGDAPRFLLSGGRGAEIGAEDPLASQRLLVAAELEDSGREARIRLAAPLSEADLREAFPDRSGWVETAEWSRRSRQVEARRREMFGAIALADQHWRDVPPEALARALADGVRERGIPALPWGERAHLLRRRIAWLSESGAADLPDWSDAALSETMDAWLTPHLAGMRRLEEIGNLDLAEILEQSLDWAQKQTMDRLAPARFQTPLGSSTAIDYAGEAPTIRVRVQEMFGVARHPEAAGQPLVIELLSPAGRPVQVTRDLPGFWAGSYADVAKEMRARYPKHPWPEHPAAAAPTRRAKPRG
ncbi:MAG: ATP-dependent helicase HrpB [Pseudomonadota bacterium]